MGVVVLFSGGHDSANLLKQAAPDCIAVFVDYGQAARFRELNAAFNICDHLGVELRVERIDKLPQRGDIYSGRNLRLIAQAIPIALEVGAGEIQIGSMDLDFDTFPDCRPDFVESISAATQSAYGVQVTAPLKTRPSYIMEGTWSCYGSGPTPCGVCRSCRQGYDE